MKPKKVKCTICGKPMVPHKDDKTNEVWDIQICCYECMKEAWNIVTSALKQGRQPHFDEVSQQRKYRWHSDEERLAVIELHKQGMTQMEISKRTGMSQPLVSRAIKQYKEGNL